MVFDLSFSVEEEKKMRPDVYSTTSKRILFFF